MKSGTFAGFVGKDAELTYTQSGTAICKFSLAVNRIGRDKDGEDLKPLWVNCAMWATRGEKLAPHILKGKFVVVSGELDVREYTDKGGKDRWSLDVNVQQFSFGGGKGDAQQEAKPQGATISASTIAEDESIPF